MEYDLEYWKSLFSISVLLTFLLWDVAWAIVKHWRREVYWVPGKALVLSGLTVVLLGYFDTLKVHVFGERMEKDLEELFQKQLATDVSRLILCVFAAYVLPRMAVDSSGQGWTNIAGLVIGLSFHIAAEVYSYENLHNVKKESNQEGDSGWFISSSITLSVAAICLVVYLGISVLNGKILSEDYSRGILFVISEIKLRNDVDYYRSKTFENEILKLWVAARAWEGHYVLYSSELSPAAGGILTICMGVLVAKVASNTALVYDVVGLPFYLECLFCVVGFLVIFVRLTVFVRSWPPNSKAFDAAAEFVNNGWQYMEHALNSRYPLNARHSEFIPRPILTCARGILEIIGWITLVTIVLALMILITLLFLFNYSCWKLFFLFIMALGVKPESLNQGNAEFLKYKPLLKEIMKRDYLSHFWKCNLKSFEGVKKSMEAACSITESSDELLKLIGRSVCQNLPRFKGKDFEEFVAQNHPRLKNKDLDDYKVNAVTAISMIVELRDKYGWNLNIFDVEILIKAYEQAKDLLEFAACPDNINIGLLNFFIKARMVFFFQSADADQMLLKVKRSLEIPKKQVPEPKPLDQVLDDFKRIQEEEGPYIWVYGVIAEFTYTDERELYNAVVSLSGEIITCCVLRLPHLIMNSCKCWTQEFQAEKIGIACGIAAKVDAIMDKYNPGEAPANTVTDTIGREIPGRENEEEEIQLNIG